MHFTAPTFVASLALLSQLAFTLPAPEVVTKVRTITLQPGETPPAAPVYAQKNAVDDAPRRNRGHGHRVHKVVTVKKPTTIPAETEDVVDTTSGNTSTGSEIVDTKAVVPVKKDPPVIQQKVEDTKPKTETAPETTTDATPSSSSGAGPSDSNMKAILDKHNEYRSAHGAGPLEWDADIEAHAKSNEASIACGPLTPKMHNQDGFGVGENLAQGTTGAGAVTMWYDEAVKKGYNYANGGFSMDTGHFTQVVWKGSTKLGCAIGCGNRLRCQYKAPGNVGGAYQENVCPLGGCN